MKRHPTGQSEACVFTLTSGVYSLIRGNMQAANLRFRNDRQLISVFGSANTNRSFWLFVVHEGRTTSTSGKRILGNSFAVNLTDTAVKIADKRHSVYLGITLATVTAEPDLVIARL